MSRTIAQRRPLLTPLVLLVLVLAALVLRAMPALDYGRDWYGAGSFTLINFDEAGSCRAALKGFPYSPLVGWQTLALTDAFFGQRPGESVRSDPARAKAFCHSETHIRVARLYSVTTGALTVVAIYLLGSLLFPRQPSLSLLAAALLALSGWHISESLMGTVDAASTLYIYGFLVAGVWARRGGGWRWVLPALLSGPALFGKYWVFALAALAGLLPWRVYAPLFAGIARRRGLALLLAYAALFGLVTNPAASPWLRWVLPPAFYLLVPWRSLARPGQALFLLLPWCAPLAMQLDLFVAFSSGGLEGRFGTDYGAIGWHKPLRNLINVPLVLLIGLGFPAFICLLVGSYRLWQHADRHVDRAWLMLLPLPAFALYMAFLAPVTYYRHYLPLLPAACLLAAFGVATVAASRARSLLMVFLLGWQALLAWDLVSDYRLDPRRQLPAWYAQAKPRQVLASYYVNPPPQSGARHGLLRPGAAPGDARRLRGVDAVVISENWYDTAFANELNGPLVGRPEQLIKTTPDAVAFYRRALAGEHPRLEKRAHLRAPAYMPELRLHYFYYGSFTQFVGDIVIFGVRP